MGEQFPTEHVARFWRRVVRNPEDGCWDWTGAGRADGYGRLMVGWKYIRAHRFAYRMLVGPIPNGLDLDHLCRNRRCVNPAHLEPVTRRENLARGIGWSGVNGRKKACYKGHPLVMGSNGKRRCKTCHAASELRRYHERKNAA